MGHVYVKLVLSNPADPQLTATVDALVDTGATLTVVPRSLTSQLKLVVTARRIVRTANGEIEVDRSSASIGINGESEINPVVISDTLKEVLVGVVTLEIFALTVDPATGQLKEGETLLLPISYPRVEDQT